MIDKEFPILKSKYFCLQNVEDCVTLTVEFPDCRSASMNLENANFVERYKLYEKQWREYTTKKF